MGYMQEQFGKFLPRFGYNISWLLMSHKGVKIENFGSAKVYHSPKLIQVNIITSIINNFVFKPIMIYKGYQRIKSNKIDIVLVRNELIIALALYYVCKIKRIPFVYYMAFPKIEYNLVQAANSNFLYKLILRLISFFTIFLRNWLILKSDYVFTMSNYWASQLIKSLPISKYKLSALPAGFDIDDYYKSENKTEIRKQFNLEKSETLFYMGSIDDTRTPEFLIKVLKKVSVLFPRIQLLILYGQGQERYLESLKKRIQFHRMSNNVILAPPVNHKKVGNYIKACMIGLSPIPTIPIFNVSTPHKFIEMLGYACPVVASDIPDQYEILKKSNGGICVPYDIESFSEAIINLLKNPSETKSMGKSGRKFIKEKRTYGIIAEKIDLCIRELCGL